MSQLDDFREQLRLAKGDDADRHEAAASDPMHVPSPQKTVRKKKGQAQREPSIPDRTSISLSRRTICAGFIPEYVWLATGGKTSLGNKLDALSVRKVVAYPDVDAYDFWYEHLAIYPNIKVSNYLQHIAGDNPSFSHMDLADLILESRLHPDTTQNPTFQQIKRYISPEYHDELEALIKDFDLEFWGVEKIEE